MRPTFHINRPKGKVLFEATLRLWNPIEGYWSEGKNLVTIDGLTKVAELMFKPEGKATQAGEQERPDVELYPRHVLFIHCGDGTDVVPTIQDDGLQHYLFDHTYNTCYPGATGKVSYKDNDMDVIPGIGYQTSFATKIEWGGADTSITEWCIGSSENYGEGNYLNHGTILHYLTGETECEVRVTAAW